MGNRVARLATPCFAPAHGHRRADGAAAAPDAHANGAAAGDDGSSSSIVGHILSFDGREGPAFAGAIHGVLLPSNQSTIGSAAGGSVLNELMSSFSGSSSFDSSNSFSFRKLQPRQYSGPLEYRTSSPSTSATTSGMSVSRQRTNEQILADLYATRHRRQCLQASSKGGPLLGGLRKAVSSVLRAASPCVSPARNPHRGGGIGKTISEGSGGKIGGGEDDGAARVQWARGKAGEDRVHVVVSEEHGWMFVGIYDGFNGPDATDYLVSNLYAAVCRELDGGVLATEAAGDRPPPRCNGGAGAGGDDEQEVLDALARALKATEEEFFAEAEARASESPELAMMGSCVLVVLIKGADVYVMNVGDSRAVLAQRGEPNLSQVLAPPRQDAGGGGGEHAGVKLGELAALQLTMDHSTSIYKEARRIKSEHLDDPACIVNGRVKGSLKVTRAFGAGYLKEVEAFTARYPDEDPAKYLSHEILLRAANQAGMEVHELLEVQQGDRRRYHDDVSIIIISLEGKIWRS
ncbi:hypothetical protein HU200_053336 [Digitaria exilis]|uniref:protein-serine/threonine phosphatase n=1 Tax=Digitaria exilis TaxID=1010633 RepID=A0A835ANG0_9POAL|nr:hypothetical protein HU200_053336 [Digitaria exilis]